MRSLRLFSLLVLIASGLVWSCSPDSDAADEEPEYDVLYYSHLVRGTNSALTDTTELVIRDLETWEALKSRMEYFEEPRSVDFSQAMLVVVALPVDTGGYQLEVDNVEYGDRRVIVTYIVYEPGGDCLNVDANITPYEVVEVRRMEAPVTFTRLREYVFCKPNL